MRLRNSRVGRKAAFNAALALAEMTQEQWAAVQGVSAGHVSLVLAGKRESDRLIGEVDTFIREHLPSYEPKELAKSA